MFNDLVSCGVSLSFSNDQFLRTWFEKSPVPNAQQHETRSDPRNADGQTEHAH